MEIHSPFKEQNILMPEWCAGMFVHKYMEFRGTPEKMECHVLCYFLCPFFIWKKKVGLSLIFQVVLKGRVKNTEHLQPLSEKVQIK